MKNKIRKHKEERYNNFLKVLDDSKEITGYRKRSNPSRGEKRIIDFLTSERIFFRREWSFKGLYNHSNKKLLYFDFFIPEFNLCIEFDGSQHYANNKPLSAQVNDFKKNAFCLKNNLNFLRIKYDQFENIETLILEKIDKTHPIINEANRTTGSRL